MNMTSNFLFFLLLCTFVTVLAESVAPTAIKTANETIFTTVLNIFRHQPHQGKYSRQPQQPTQTHHLRSAVAHDSQKRQNNNNLIHDDKSQYIAQRMRLQACPCGGGYYCSLGTCMSCPPGSACPGDDLQVPCPSGTFSAGGTSTCTTCTTLQMTTAPGSNTCSMCIYGKYCPVGADYPEVCPDGYRNSALGTVITSSCAGCAAGQFATGGASSCVACPAGYYCPGESGMLPCPVGTVTASGGSELGASCNGCPAGRFTTAPGAASCTNCPAGTYCVGGTEKRQCPPGKYIHTFETTSVSGCYSCDAGTYSSGEFICANCPAGSFCPTVETAVPCPAGYHSTATGSGAVASTVCSACASTKYSTSGSSACTDCPAGGYCPPGMAFIPCPTGYYSNQVSKSLFSGVCTAVASGAYTIDGLAPTACTPGGYCPGRHARIPCPVGSYTPWISASDAAACQITGQGAYSTEGATGATPCPPGHYCPGGSDKIPCPEGYYSTDTSATSAAVCKACPVAGMSTDAVGATTCVVCGNGQYCPAGTSLQYCPTGYVSLGFYATSPTSCVACGPGFYAPVQGASVCVFCKLGQYCPGGANNMIPCPAGRYSTVARATAFGHCAVCQVGFYSQQGASVCLICPPGFYCPGSSDKVPCPAGYVMSAADAVQADSCAACDSPCPAGKYTTGSGEVECRVCPTGHYCPGRSDAIKCPAGHINAGAAGSTTLSACTPCPAERYPDPTGSICVPCPPGYYCPGGTDRIPCPKGHYNTLVSRASCSACSPGGYAEGTASVGCLTCKAGGHCPGGPDNFVPSTQPVANPSAVPSAQPSSQPSRRPSGKPSMVPTLTPSAIPSAQPSLGPYASPSVQPSAQPSAMPSMQPSSQPSGCPSNTPSMQPTAVPSVTPSSQPSVQPQSIPSAKPSAVPSTAPSVAPSSQPSAVPSSQPSMHPTAQPSSQPSVRPSNQPSSCPSTQPSARPTTQPSASPSLGPTSQPSVLPTFVPSAAPSAQPTVSPSMRPAAAPSSHPSREPSAVPSTQPSAGPSAEPSVQPTGCPSAQPSIRPTEQPSGVPSAQPSSYPTTQPSPDPSVQPSIEPFSQPTGRPSAQPSASPISRPSMVPSVQPSALPSVRPSTRPSGQPSCIPTMTSSFQPFSEPTSRPSSCPSDLPVSMPSLMPTAHPTGKPLVSTTAQPTEGSPSGQSTVSPTAAPSTAVDVNPTMVPISSKPTLSVIPTPQSTAPKFAVPLSVIYTDSSHGASNFTIVLPFLFTSTVFGFGVHDVVVSAPTAGVGYLLSFHKISAATTASNRISVAGLDVVVPVAGADTSGRSVANAGDVNGDGYDDLIIGVPYAARVYVLFGTKQGFVNMTEGFTIFGAKSSDLTGWSVSSAGDVNNDTFADIIVGAPHSSSVTGSHPGAAVVIYGQNCSADVHWNEALPSHRGFILYGAAAQDALGLSVSGAGDVNGDGYDDIIVGALRQNALSAGAAYIVYGGKDIAGGVVTSLPMKHAVIIRGEAFSWFGYSVSSAGRFNDDRFADVIVGSFLRRSPTDPQISYLVFGAANLSHAVVASAITAPQGVIVTGGGIVVAGLGDISGGGHAEVLIGSDFPTDTGSGFVVHLPSALPPATGLPSVIPSRSPTAIPSRLPTADPSVRPTQPTAVPTAAPSGPTHLPTLRPTQPTATPSAVPTAPSCAPSLSPTVAPSLSPSNKPTWLPTVTPTVGPTHRPTVIRTSVPSTTGPSAVPTTAVPSRYPVVRPTATPTVGLTTLESTYTDTVIITRNGTYDIAPNLSRTHYIINSTDTVIISTGPGAAALFTVVPNVDSSAVIGHFNASADVIDLRLFDGIQSLAQLLAAALTGNGTSLTVALGRGQTLTLSGVSASDLTALNFLFSTQQSIGGSDDAVSGSGQQHNNNSTAVIVAASTLCVFIAYVLYHLVTTWLSEGKFSVARVEPIKWEAVSRYNNRTFITFLQQDLLLDSSSSSSGSGSSSSSGGVAAVLIVAVVMAMPPAVACTLRRYRYRRHRHCHHSRFLIRPSCHHLLLTASPLGVTRRRRRQR